MDARTKAIIKVDLKDYINMRNSNITSLAQWNRIKHYHANDNLDTVWQVVMKRLNAQYPDGIPIGVLEPPVQYIQDILNDLN